MTIILYLKVTLNKPLSTCHCLLPGTNWAMKKIFLTPIQKSKVWGSEEGDVEILEPWIPEWRKLGTVPLSRARNLSSGTRLKLRQCSLPAGHLTPHRFYFHLNTAAPTSQGDFGNN